MAKAPPTPTASGDDVVHAFDLLRQYATQAEKIWKSAYSNVPNTTPSDIVGVLAWERKGFLDELQLVKRLLVADVPSLGWMP